jgi:hypothetical protein
VIIHEAEDAHPEDFGSQGSTQDDHASGSDSPPIQRFTSERPREFLLHHRRERLLKDGALLREKNWKKQFSRVAVNGEPRLAKPIYFL